jgi:predicted nucleic acid-binding Zn ribbon protein
VVDNCVDVSYMKNDVLIEKEDTTNKIDTATSKVQFIMKGSVNHSSVGYFHSDSR